MSRKVEKLKYYCLISMSISSIIALDQLIKGWIVSHIEENHIGYSYLGGFLRIIHVRNLGIAFSLGNGLPDAIRTVFFIFLPVLFLFYLIYWLAKDDFFARKSSYPWLNRLALILIIGGGLGNLIDRIFRQGVVDFIDVQFFGLLGLQRWPAFNIADSSVFLGACCWLVLLFLPEGKRGEKDHEKG